MLCNNTCRTVMMMVKMTAPNWATVEKMNSWPAAEQTAVRRQSVTNAGCCTRNNPHAPVVLEGTRHPTTYSSGEREGIEKSALLQK